MIIYIEFAGEAAPEKPKRGRRKHELRKALTDKASRDAAEALAAYNERLREIGRELAHGLRDI